MKLVSAIMPTRGRQKWARQAMRSFMAQTYEPKELVILDDADDLSYPDADQMPELKYFMAIRSIKYYMSVGPQCSIPEKRNWCCEMASGKIVIHWDSDDWSAPNRIADQVQRLEESDKAMTGYNSILFYEEQTAIWGRYVLDNVSAFGTSLCYRKSWWMDHPFDEALTIGEDNRAVMIAGGEQQFVTADGTSMMVARVHAGNTSHKDMGNCRPIDPAIIPKGFPL